MNEWCGCDGQGLAHKPGAKGFKCADSCGVDISVGGPFAFVVRFLLWAELIKVEAVQVHVPPKDIIRLMGQLVKALPE